MKRTWCKEPIMSCPRVTRLIFATLGSLSLVLLSGLMAIASAGQPPPSSADDAALAPQGDPPGRVARISFLSGTTSFRPATLDDWTPATVNYPLTVGDHLWTDRGARAELDLGTDRKSVV